MPSQAQSASSSSFKQEDSALSNSEVVTSKISDSAKNNELPSILIQDNAEPNNVKNAPSSSETSILEEIHHQHYDSVWDELSEHFDLVDQYQQEYQDYTKYYLRHKSYLKRVSKRAKPYLYHILQEVKQRDMPYEIALLPAVESGFSPKAKSYQSAAGLWQFIPGTAHLYNLKKDWWYDGRLDLIHSTNAALDYLQRLHKLNKDDWLLALASYNAGYGNILKAQRKLKKRHPNKKPTFWNIRKYLPKETQNYVPQLFAIAYLVKHRDQYDIALVDVPNEPYLQPIPLKQQVNLKQICQITGLPESTVKLLNPCYLQPTTPPTGKHHLVLPIKKAKLLQQKLAENDNRLQIKWAKHKVKPGESLSVIAHKYHTSIREIKRINHMKTNLVRAGKTLLIPYPEKYAQKIPQMDQKKYHGKKYYHTVKRGESIWSIANYYNVSNQTLCRWNNIGIRTPLRVGQKLEIRSNQYGKKITHTLKKGQSLWTVAKKYGVTTTELAKWNRIKRSKVLQPGDKLVIWLPKNQPLPYEQRYVVKPGDSLWKIAKNFQLPQKKIIEHNNLDKTAYLSPGQVILIPAGS